MPEESKTIGARFNPYWQGRIAEVIKEMSRAIDIPVDTSDVVVMCVKSGLPRLEKKYGIKPPKEPEWYEAQPKETKNPKS